MTASRAELARTSLKVGLALGATLALGLLLFGSSDNTGGADQPDAELAGLLQKSVSYDYYTLEEEGFTLTDVAAKADVVGVGRFVDVRPGPQHKLPGGTPEEEEVLSRVLLVIKPDRLSEGAGLLGKSGLVFIDQPAPSVDAETGSTGISELKEAAVASPDRVAFMLTIEPPPFEGTQLVDEFAGRSEDDPLLELTHPTSLLSLDETQRIASPLMVAEEIADKAANVKPIADLETNIDGFSTEQAGQIATGSP